MSITVSVARRYTFVAHHALLGAPEPWCNDHGHVYTVEIVYTGEVQADGMIVDTDRIDADWAKLADTRFAGRDLNVSFPDLPTSVENLASWLLGYFIDAAEVTVWEDEDRWGRARR